LLDRRPIEDVVAQLLKLLFTEPSSGDLATANDIISSQLEDCLRKRLCMRNKAVEILKVTDFRTAILRWIALADTRSGLHHAAVPEDPQGR
jgi:N12 class adenine-specific DNA methylase